METQILTVDAKHIFIDIVNYTYNRSIEAQSHIIGVLNRIVLETIEEAEIPRVNVIFIPTGDGMCISLINILNRYDVHLEIGLLILNKLSDYNKSQENTMKKFSIRMGINENIDNLIVDINNQKNISGSGINYASRIEGLADENQILVGNSVFEKLVQREKYMESFTTYTASVKHGVPLKVHQYRNDALGFLNSEIPSQFKPAIQGVKRLTELEAYYLANCIRFEEFISTNITPGQSGYSMHVGMFQLANDELAKSKITRTHKSYPKRVHGTIQEYFSTIQATDFWIIADFKNFIVDRTLNAISDCFSEPYLFVNENGKSRLKEEHMEIFESANSSA